MTARWILIGLAGLVFGLAARGDDEMDARRAGLQALNEFIGRWNGAGGPDKPKPDPKDPTWQETLDWCWRFKGTDAWLSLNVKDGKYVQALRFATRRTRRRTRCGSSMPRSSRSISPAGWTRAT